MSEQENKPEPSSCCRTLVESLSSENARLKATNAQLEASFSEVLKIIEGGNTVGLGHVYVDSHYYDSEEDDYDYYDHDCHYNPKNKTRECMGEDEIRTVLKLLNAGVKRFHDFTKLREEDREDFEVEVEEGDWKIMIKIEEYGDYHDAHFSLKLEQKNRAPKDGPMKFHADARHVMHPKCFHRRCGEDHQAFCGFSYQDTDGKETCMMETYDDGRLTYDISFFHINLSIIEESKYRDVREVGTGYW